MASTATKAAKTIRTTVALPAELLELVDRAVDAGEARSRNEFVAAALRRELEARGQDAIDAAFAEMADDEDYQRETLQLMAEFASADRESFPPAEAAP